MNALNGKNGAKRFFVPMPTKRCLECGIVKKRSEFYECRSKGGNGLFWCCKICARKRKTPYRELSEERKEKIREQNRRRYRTSRHKIWLNKYLNNPLVKKRSADYMKNRMSDPRIRERAYQATRRYRASSLGYKIAKNLRERLRRALRKGEKSNSTIKLLGCSVEFLVAYLERKFRPGMSWDNYSYRGWHIDHIRPCASFDLSKKSQQRKCFHFSNLQPLWAHDNHVKSDSINVAQ